MPLGAVRRGKTNAGRDNAQGWYQPFVDPHGGNGVTLFMIYSLGFAGIFALLLLLYLHAWHRRHELQLSEYEVHDTVTSMWMYAGYIGIGILSSLIAVLCPRWLAWAGWSYFLLGPISAFIGGRRGYGRRALHERLIAATE